MNRAISETNELDDTRYFVYDAGLLYRRVDREGRVRQFHYDRFARLEEEVWYNSQSDADSDIGRRGEFDFSYDRGGRLSAVDGAFADYAYQYDEMGNTTQITADIAGLTGYVPVGATCTICTRKSWWPVS